MNKVHFVNPDSVFPFCIGRVDMMNNFKDTDKPEDVTCTHCKIKLGLIPEMRGRPKKQ